MGDEKILTFDGMEEEGAPDDILEALMAEEAEEESEDAGN